MMDEILEEFPRRFQALKEAVGQVMVGQDEVVDLVLTALFADGHCLLEGLPGLGKTQLVKTLSEALGLKFSRIQFTPDLMPADVTGTNIIEEDEHGRKRYAFREGPIFSQLVLADEINRATPKTQSALLEAMQERTVTSWGETRPIDRPLLVLATQNPIEMEGTYPLPEAQLDRFLFKVLVPRPGRSELVEIVERSTRSHPPAAQTVMEREELLRWQSTVRDVAAAPQVLDFAARLVEASHSDGARAPELVDRYVRFGASPRAAQSLVLAGKVRALADGRPQLAYMDLRWAAPAVFRHRLVLGYEAQVDDVTADKITAALLEAVPDLAEDAA
ncbi:MAG TPA: AAA family ATPase [Planctomycetes bacterium]|nr:AAA family ATPase [Planctomycetota bacterium]